MIDRIRQLYPHLAIGVYAFEPGGGVQVEVLTPDGTRFERKARTVAEAFAAIFGPLPDDEIEQSAVLTPEPEDVFS